MKYKKKKPNQNQFFEELNLNQIELLIKNKIFLDQVKAFGHPNVLGTNRNTIEITTENFLTKEGDCIIAINGSKAIKDLNSEVKKRIHAGEKLTIVLKAGEFVDIFEGFGDSQLTMENSVSFVFRKSQFISDRTVLLRCTKVALDLSRKMMQYLQDPTHQIDILFYGDI